MLEFMRMFRSPGNFRSGSYDYEECGTKPDGSRIFVVTGIENRSGERGKVCEVCCKANDKMCRNRLLKLLKSFERNK